MREIGIAIWTLFAGYTLVCVGLPDIRIFYWKGSESKMGRIAYLGLALFLWSPLLVVLRIIPHADRILLYPLMLTAFGLLTIGYRVDTRKL
jgi:hypothetical protein